VVRLSRLIFGLDYRISVHLFVYFATIYLLLMLCKMLCKHVSLPVLMDKDIGGSSLVGHEHPFQTQ
jgi:hypothetical protein